MNWYYARDGKQAGPVEEGELATLVAAGVIHGSTLVWKEGLAQWIPYREVWAPGMPDWRQVQVPSSAQEPSTQAATSSTSSPSPRCSICQNIFKEDELVVVERESVCALCKPIRLQRLKEGVLSAGTLTGFQQMEPEMLVQAAALRTEKLVATECVSRAWELFKKDPALAILTVVAAYGVMLATGWIPILGPIIGIVINPVLLGGMWLVNIRALRDEPTSVGDVFAPFSKGWGSTVIVNLMTIILSFLVLLPCLVPIGILAFSGKFANGSLTPGEIAMCVVPVILTIPFLIYISMAFLFAIPLAVDRGYGAWDSMVTSLRVVNKQLLPILLLSIICILLLFAGTLAVCVGLLVTGPLVVGSMAAAYEELFGSRVRLP